MEARRNPQALISALVRNPFRDLQEGFCLLLNHDPSRVKIPATYKHLASQEQRYEI